MIPALAIAQELQKRYNAEVLFIGTARGIENRLVPAAGFPLKLVQVGALKNVSLATRLKTSLDLPRAVLRARRMLAEFKPDIVIGVGGYASGPAMLAAVLKRIPTLAFEPNVVPGFANRMVARFVSGAAVHFEETKKFFRRAEVTGVPVREAFLNLPAKPPGTSPTLLVFGGSQGAHAINQAVMEAVPTLRQRIPGIHIVHQTGERDYEAAKNAYAAFDGSIEPTVLLTTCPPASPKPTSCSAALEQAQLLRSQPQPSQPFSCPSQAPPTITRSAMRKPGTRRRRPDAGATQPDGGLARRSRHFSFLSTPRASRKWPKPRESSRIPTQPRRSPPWPRDWLA